MGYRNRVLSALDALKKYEREARVALLLNPPDVNEVKRAMIDALSEVHGALSELYDSTE